MTLTERIDTKTAEIEALTAYANGVTGQADASIGDAVKTLCDGYGGGESPLNYICDLTCTDSTYGSIDLTPISLAGEHLYIILPKSGVHHSGNQNYRNPAFGVVSVMNPRDDTGSTPTLVIVNFLIYNNSWLSRTFSESNIDAFGNFAGTNICRFNGKPVYAAYEIIKNTED